MSKHLEALIDSIQGMEPYEIDMYIAALLGYTVREVECAEEHICYGAYGPDNELLFESDMWTQVNDTPYDAWSDVPAFSERFEDALEVMQSLSAAAPQSSVSMTVYGSTESGYKAVLYIGGTGYQCRLNRAPTPALALCSAYLDYIFRTGDADETTEAAYLAKIEAVQNVIAEDRRSGR